MKVSERLSSALMSAQINARTWAGMGYNASAYGVYPGTDDMTAALQALVNKANDDGVKTIIMPPGQYRVTSLSNDSGITFVGDNASFIGGYTGIIYPFGSLIATLNELGEEVVADAKRHADMAAIYDRALIDSASNANIGRMTATMAAIKAKTIKIAFVGDSITEGLGLWTSDDVYANRFIAKLTKALTGVTVQSQNFSVAGRAIVNFNNEAYVATNPETSTSFWRPWATVGKSWRQHVKDYAPDLVIFAFGMNSVGTNVYAYRDFYQALSVSKVYFDGFTKVPDLIMVPTIMPTARPEFDYPQSQEGTVYVARANREFARFYNINIADANRMFMILRDGTDPDGTYGYLEGIPSASLQGDTSAFNLTGGTVKQIVGGSGFIVRNTRKSYNADLTYNVKFSPPNSTDNVVSQTVYRYTAEGGGYLIQLMSNSAGNCVIQLYYLTADGSVSLKGQATYSTALLVETTLSVKIVTRGLRQTLSINGTQMIDIYEYAVLHDGYFGVRSSFNGIYTTVSTLQGVYLLQYGNGTGLLTEAEMFGETYPSNQGGGNGINHLTGPAYAMVYEPPFMAYVDRMASMANLVKAKEVGMLT
ncbi:SGNH/GDSL hydrolase family protein [Gorillibacterium sp. CAU 1737]|uniref:SGNH/GDSL hydrolase family protein n=1 Tax=Gorillibacterium sp. CAU 1737 TaxID=3140362 RepID=UPI00326165C7